MIKAQPTTDTHAETSPSPSGRRPIWNPARMTNVNVLLVDDQPSNLIALEAVLDGMGLNLIKAHSGEEALLLTDGETAVVLLDVKMEGMDGFETAQLLRGRILTRHTPIIFMTAYDDNRLSIEEAYKLGAVDYLVKPIIPVLLRSKVAGFVDLFKKTREIEAISKRLEESLRDSEQRFHTLFELGPIAVYSCDVSGVIREFNHRAAELWGREPKVGDTSERFCGSYKMRCADGSLMAHADCPMADVLTGRLPEVHDGEVVIERPDGSRIIVIVNIRPLKNERGDITGALNCFYDVTDRKAAEERLRQSEQRLTSLVDSSNDAIVTKTLDCIIQSWNPAAERLFGYEAAQAIGQHISFIIPPDRIQEEALIIARQRAGERVEHFDTVRVRKDGTPVEVSLTISPIKDAEGRVVGASKIARDITSQKRLQEELREANQRKDAFLAMLAHELRNPLAPISNALNILRLTEGKSESLRSAVEMMDRQLGQMIRLVDDLLDVSRISRGRIELRKGRIELASAVNHAVEAVRAMYENMNHELTVVLPKAPIYLNADPTRLAQ